MKRSLSLLLIILFTTSCSKKFSSTELDESFTKAEIRDLYKLTYFFQMQMCGNTRDFKSCIDSLIPNLLDYGYTPIVEEIDFTEQQALYESFESDLFIEIWSFCKAQKRGEEWRKTPCLNYDGKYYRFLKKLSIRNEHLKKYHKSMIEIGSWERMGLLERNIFINPENYDLNDPSIQVLITIHYLTINDEIKRKEPWSEN